jgi:3'(2'), 5'-bisphosphate nucleotidase
VEQALVALAQMAGDAILGVYERGNWEMTLKSDRSPLTDADRASHDILCDGLAQIFPGIPILSEESDGISYDQRKDWDTFFLIDPLDGTREFVAKIPEFAINIALVEKGHPIAGIVHSPLHRTTYYAEKGKGAWRIREGRESLRASSNTANVMRVLLSRTDESSDLDRLLHTLPEPIVSRMGSSLKFSAVASGVADFYPRLKPSMEWDTASGTILVQESGGLMCGLNGELIEYNREDMLNPPFFAFGPSFFDKMPDWKKLLSI